MNSVINVTRNADDNIVLSLTCSATGHTMTLVCAPDEARAIARHLLAFANQDTQYTLAPPSEATLTDVFNAMVGAFNLMTRGTLTQDNIPSKYSHMFREVPK